MTRVLVDRDPASRHGARTPLAELGEWGTYDLLDIVASSTRQPLGSSAALALSALFRSAMASVCTPVSVVTTVEGGRPHGATVSAFTSLSMNPPMVLVSLDKSSQLLSMVERTGAFGLNVLGADQAGLALRFAEKGLTKFEGLRWTHEQGAARLEDSGAWLACAVASIVDGGDHRVVLGNVLAAQTWDVEPLTYHARTFGTHRRP